MKTFIFTFLLLLCFSSSAFAENINDLPDFWHNPNVTQELTGNINWSGDFPKPRFNSYSQLFYAHYDGDWHFYLLETDSQNDTYLWSENNPYLRLNSVEYDLETRKFIEYELINDEWQVSQLGNDFLDYTSKIPFYILVQTNQSLAYGTAYGATHLEPLFLYTDNLSNNLTDNELLTQLTTDFNTFAYHIQNFVLFLFLVLIIWILLKFVGAFFNPL